MSKYNFKISMDRNLALACHLTLWAYMFLSPMTFWRGTGITLPHYLMISMQPLLLMIVFYLNYLYLAPKFFVSGKHRYDLLINIVVISSLGTFLHYWMDWTNDLYMPQRWQHIEEARKEAEAARAEAELSNLRNQLNPHFLLNTLNNIYALTAFDTAKAQETIQELSKMLRHILYDYQQPTVPLNDEIEFLENYVKLMRIRLPETVDVTFTTEIQDSNVQIAPMIFISLVENAFKHGISPTEPSFIRINISADKHFIYCEITNSNHPKTESDHSGHGIGLQQVQRRLDLAYPDHYTWQKGTKENNTIYYSTITIQL